MSNIQYDVDMNLLVVSLKTLLLDMTNTSDPATLRAWYDMAEYNI